MLEDNSIKLLKKMNDNSFHHYCIQINDIIDIVLIPKNEFFNYFLEVGRPKEYKKIFFLKKNNTYVGCFLANTDHNDNQTDLQFFILEEYRKQVDYISSFNDYVFPSLFVQYDKLKISFKHEKIKKKFSKIEILSKLYEIKGNRVTIKRKDVYNLLKNDYFYLENHFLSWVDKYNSIKNILTPFLKSYSLEQIIESEEFSYVGNSYIIHYYHNYNNINEIINLHIQCVELYFIIKSLK